MRRFVRRLVPESVRDRRRGHREREAVLAASSSHGWRLHRCDEIDLTMLLNVDHYLDYVLFREGVYERSTLETISRVLGAGLGNFIDVGSNIGLMSLFVAKHFPEVRIESFEPFPNTLVQQRANMLLNDVRYPLNEVALSDSDGELTLYLEDPREGLDLGKLNPASVSILPGDQAEDRGTRVGAVTMDHALGSTSPAFDPDRGTLVKIDVEGAETMVLGGMSGLFASKAPLALIVELSYEKRPERCRDIDGSLHRAGFEMFDYQSDGTAAVPLPGGRPAPLRNGTFLFGRGV